VILALIMMMMIMMLMPLLLLACFLPFSSNQVWSDVIVVVVLLLKLVIALATFELILQLTAYISLTVNTQQSIIQHEHTLLSRDNGSRND